MARHMSKGQCHLCGGTFGKAAMTRHLKSCKQKEDSEASPADRGSRIRAVFHLVVEGRYASDYWMHLEIPADARLEVLDNFLRDVWLECCGHMSAFEIEGRTYSVAPMADFGDASMNVKLSDILSPGMKLYHEYDFGSTTYLVLKVVSQEQRQIKGKSVRVLARNEPPEFSCMSCGKTATLLCPMCIYSGEGCLCDECAPEHECGDDMLLPIVNSPRVGVCGYTGD